MEFPKFDVTVDLILILREESGKRSFAFITRNAEPEKDKAALIGGYYNAYNIVDSNGYTVEQIDKSAVDAVVRETEEEIGLKIDPCKVKFFNFFDKIWRDPRGRTLTLVHYYEFKGKDNFYEDIYDNFSENKEVKRILVLSEDNLRFFLREEPYNFAFDHDEIIKKFLGVN